MSEAICKSCVNTGTYLGKPCGCPVGLKTKISSLESEADKPRANLTGSIKKNFEYSARVLELESQIVRLTDALSTLKEMWDKGTGLLCTHYGQNADNKILKAFEALTSQENILVKEVEGERCQHSQKAFDMLMDACAERNTRIKDLTRCLDIAVLHIDKERCAYWPETTKLARLNLFRTAIEKAAALFKDKEGS